MSAVRLHEYWRSSAAYRVRIALNLAGIAYESVPVDLLAGAQRDPGFLALNPQGLVPVLEIDGHVMTQSLAIIEYLDETRGTGFLPADPVARQRVRALAHVIAMETHPVCTPAVAGHAHDASGGAIRTEDWMQRFIRRGLDAFERLLDSPATGPYCHGAAIGLADICLIPQIYNATRWHLDVTSYPNIEAVVTRLARVPAVAAAEPDKSKPKERHND